MVANPLRRAQLSDAALAVLARSGLRGVTHRAVDAEAGVPAGTTSNYFADRARLLSALTERVYERLQPDAAVLQRLESQPRTRETFADYMRDIVRRATNEPTLILALWELRIESTRNPDVAELVGATVRRAFDFDVQYHRASGLPGDEVEVSLLHWAIDGLLMDTLGPAMGSSLDTDAAVDLLVERLVPTARA
ncbi:TetR/AcrR family transcriptional regulator [Microcella humidisoli]|uniref:TetR family transcriptional regulator n=1 Tax=Microcella humidisoli TaxID=2963406 RepID=A0ABY5FW01_9MICO|nr:TetR/AcrR family transcriptional regulator [Microcella humidisoli]UTT61956.1 TetR family transcriptional regulator [Microcella humidisoli]